MTRYQTVTRPSGPLTRTVLVGLLAQLGEHHPKTSPRTRRKPREMTR